MKKLFIFFKEAWSELKQVSWLPVPQMVASTWLVVILVVIMSLYLGIVDFILSRVIGLFI